MYRPPGFKNPFTVESGNLSRIADQEAAIFEAGADALIEALFDLARESPTGTFVIDSKMVRIYSCENH